MKQTAESNTDAIEKGRLDLIEKRAKISDAQKAYFGQKLSALIERKKAAGQQRFAPDVAEGYIYNFLTRRIAPDEARNLISQFNKKEQDDYEQAITVLRTNYEPSGYEVKEGIAWVGVSKKNKFAMQEKIIQANAAENITVRFKEYFSFVPRSQTHEGVVEEINQFVGSLGDLAEKLYQLGLENNDEINIKIPRDLAILLYHPDSLVVHYRNEKIGLEIRKIVQDTLEARGVLVGRTDRTESGFDFESNHGKASRLSGSHSELISRIVSNQITQELNNNPGETPKIFQDSSKAASWTMHQAQEIGTLRPEYLLKHLVQI